MAGYQALQLLELVNQASVIINTAGSVILAAFGGGMDAFNQGINLSAVPLPSTPYTQPGA